MNIALYREYRPKTFDEVIGQEHIVKTLKNQIKTDNLSHAYLFCGTRGTGKTSTAKIFAKAINCQNNNDGSPCFECEVCKALLNNSNLDVLEIDAASNNRVDEIRELRDKIKYPPVNGKYKVYIIDEVHMLTDSAYNALLKTLEEPPKHAIFILCTTEVHKLPQTILSRCMRIDFRLVSVDDLTKLLVKIFNEKNIKYEEEALHLIATRGEGSVRDTLSIADLCASFSNYNITYQSCLEALGSSSSDVLLNLADSLAENDGEKLLIEINEIANSGKNFSILAKEFVNFLKNLLTIKTVSNSQKFLMLPNDIFEKYKLQADKFSKEELLNAMTKLSNIETALKYSINPKTLVEITLLGLLDEKKTEFVEKKTKLESLNNNKKEKQENLTNSNKKDNDIFKENEIKQNLNSETINNLNDSLILTSENLNDSDVFRNNACTKTNKSEISSQIVVAKILKTLRNNSSHLLQSIYQTLIDSEIIDRKLIILFDNENNKEILEKSVNILEINDIIKEFDLTIEYKYNNSATEKSTEQILKEKFNNLEIKE